MKAFPSYFADAEEIYRKAKFVIFGLPYDRTSSFRSGSRLAPKEIRKASWNFESYDIFTDVDLSELPIHDYGDLDIEDKDSGEMIEEIKTFSRRLIGNRKIPVAIGGEHSVTVGIIEGFDNIFTIFLDAHLDYRDQYENNRYNHACTLRRITEHIGVENTVAIGIRSAEKEELMRAKHDGLKFITSKEIFSNGINKIIENLDEQIDNQKVYLSLDFDVIDPAYAPGVSTPEPFGLNPEDILKIVNRFSDRIVGFDVVEICPSYDTGITSLLAAKLIRIFIALIWKNNTYI